MSLFWGWALKYKIYEYEIIDQRGRSINPDRHYAIFHESRGADPYGNYSLHRGKQDAVLMNLRPASKDFMGLVGKHSTEREITLYSDSEDAAYEVVVSDDDYPHTMFVCLPRLGAIFMGDTGRIKADSAMRRLHSILAARAKVRMQYRSITEAYDLKYAVEKFRVYEVNFEIRPVNPHSGDLGKELDEARKRDHIRQIAGKAKAAKDDKLQLEGGFLSAVNDLQRSGHARVGYHAEANDGILVDVQKPPESDIEAYEDWDQGPKAEMRIDFPGLRLTWPISQAHVTALRKLARAMIGEKDSR